jgi:hypothetical protein
MELQNPLSTYLKDHLAGARFALSLLDDLLDHEQTDYATLLRELRGEIETDRSMLLGLLHESDESESLPKELLAKLGEKAARLKLPVTSELGRFESIELLSLGVLGKLALWRTMEALRPELIAFNEVPVVDLISRARSQHDRLEQLRIKLARQLFLQMPSKT